MIVFNLNHIKFINRTVLIKEEKIMKKSILNEEVDSVNKAKYGILE